MLSSKVKVYPNGTKEWHLNVKLHREDGPAIENSDRSKYWFLNDKLHREDGPAIECFDGYKAWFLNGKYHREDGPAVEYSDGSKFWYLNGKLHREDGPTYEGSSGSKYWYLNEVNYSKEDWKIKIELENLRIEEVKNLFYPGSIFRLKGTNFGYIKFQYQWVNLIKENYLNDITFEYVLDNVSIHVQEELLFHLDYFIVRKNE